jgi:hypothetical protein
MKQKYYLQINYARLLLSIITCCFINFILFFVVFAYQETGNGTENGFYIARSIFILLDFPLYILSEFFVFSTWINFIIGLLASAVFNSLLLEAFIIYRKKDKSKIVLRNS